MNLSPSAAKAPSSCVNSWLVEASLGIARSLGLEVVAEGVEKKEEAERLRDLGCQYAQGFFYGKAMTAEELLALLKKQGN